MAGSLISITPDGKYIYATDSSTNDILILDRNQATGAISTNPNSPITPGGTINGLAITPDGLYLFATTQTPDNVFRFSIDPATGNLTNSQMTAAGSAPQGIAITPDSATAYVCNSFSAMGPNNITMIDVATLTPTPITNPSIFSPRYIVITPDQAPVAKFTVKPGVAGTSTQFDASTSNIPLTLQAPAPGTPASIVLYQWDFGDMTTLSTSNPTVMHTYATPGTYIVTLQITNSANTSISQTFTGQTAGNEGIIPISLSPPISNGDPSGLLTKEISIFVPSPTNFVGRQLVNEFLTQKEYINRLSWNPPTAGTPPVAYAIYRDSALTQLVAEVPATVFTFSDHNRFKEIVYTYYLVAIDQQGNRSPPLVVSVP